MERLKFELWWLIVSYLMMIIGGLSSVMRGLLSPDFSYETLIMAVVFSTAAPLALAHIVRLKWWVRGLLAVFTVPAAILLASNCASWGSTIRWPNGNPMYDTSVNSTAAQEGALSGFLGILLSVLITIVWVTVDAWLSKRTSEKLRLNPKADELPTS